jgi:DNA-binding response OmpR family regulator
MYGMPRIGSSGYLLKDISPTELIAAIRALHTGLVQISPKIATKLINAMYDGTSPKIPEVSSRFEWFDTLTDRRRRFSGSSPRALTISKSPTVSSLPNRREKQHQHNLLQARSEGPV